MTNEKERNTKYILNKELNFFEPLSDPQKNEHLRWLYTESSVAAKLQKTGKYRHLFVPKKEAV